ncbi:RING-H2 finger protein ATL52-like [Fagus crenata]
MGSMNNPNSWSPYGTYKDCSQGICSIYCPQWCYVIIPPPPFGLGDDNDPSAFQFSPLIVAVIGILASAFILVCYYTIISKYCRRRGNSDTSMELNHNRDFINHESLQGASSGLDETLIKSIKVCKYKKGDGSVEGTDCSVCLSEFQENESLRLLPKCNHAFHVPCIDTWLKSHSSCPLCRSNINIVASTNSLPPQLPANPIQETPPATNVSALQYQHANDTILVVQDLEGDAHEEAVVSLVISGHDVIPKTSIQAHGHGHRGISQTRDNMIEIRQDGVIQPLRRSLSMNYSLCQGNVSIADILREDHDDEDEEYTMEILDIGTSKGLEEIQCKANDRKGMKRSISTGRFMFTRYGKGSNSVIPN